MTENLPEMQSLGQGEGNGNPLQYSCLENSMDRGPWGATVHTEGTYTLIVKSWKASGSSDVLFPNLKDEKKEAQRE